MDRFTIPIVFLLFVLGCSTPAVSNPVEQTMTGKIVEITAEGEVKIQKDDGSENALDAPTYMLKEVNVGDRITVRYWMDSKDKAHIFKIEKLKAKPPENGGFYLRGKKAEDFSPQPFTYDFMIAVSSYISGSAI